MQCTWSSSCVSVEVPSFPHLRRGPELVAGISGPDRAGLTSGSLGSRVCRDSAPCSTKERRRHICAIPQTSAAACGWPVGMAHQRSTWLTTMLLIRAGVYELRVPYIDITNEGRV